MKNYTFDDALSFHLSNWERAVNGLREIMLEKDHCNDESKEYKRAMEHFNDMTRRIFRIKCEWVSAKGAEEDMRGGME